jgi:hypothetical protein
MGAIVEGPQSKEVTPPPPEDPSVMLPLDQVIQRCIAGSVVDREAMVARFHARRVPGLTREIERALKSDGDEGFVVSCRSARNREPAAATTLIVHLEYRFREARAVRVS